MITAVLFDFYDTLVDIKTEDWGDDAMRGVAYFLRYRGLHLRRAELRERARDALQRQIDGSSELHFQFDLALMWRNVIEESSPDLVASLGPEGLVPFSQSLATIQRSQSRVQFELVNGAIETLEALAEHYRLGVVSDGQGAFVRAELRELGISRYFDVVVVAGDLGYRKPDPRLFRHAIEQMGTDSTASVYVGTDPERDARASDAIGMHPVLVGYRSVPEELVGVPVRPVRELSHVPDAVASVVARLRTQATHQSVAKPASPQDVVERTSHA